jgi:hypothetical protein
MDDLLHSIMRKARTPYGAQVVEKEEGSWRA